jgi:tRNA threonylcarbamoyladenosine biosynthesis protein TsaB
MAINPSQKDHAAWLQPAISGLLKQQDLSLHDLDAIAVSAGPGSYTGLRVGMATVKGLCYPLNKPLILISTLQMMAAGAADHSSALLCPMIDARRMEVFTAVYTQSLAQIIAPHNCILTNETFANLLSTDEIVFFGNGSSKFEPLVSNSNAIFKQIETTAEQMAQLSYNSFKNEQFANLAYCEPFYGKEFYSPAFQKS